MGRNEMAKWRKANSRNFDRELGLTKNIDIEDIVPGFEDEYDNLQVVGFPPMTHDTHDCRTCFSKDICHFAACSMEPTVQYEDPTRTEELETLEKNTPKEVRDYFKRMYECIELEQRAGMNDDYKQKNEN